MDVFSHCATRHWSESGVRSVACFHSSLLRPYIPHELRILLCYLTCILHAPARIVTCTGARAVSMSPDPHASDLERSRNGIFPIREVQRNARSFDKRSANEIDVEVANDLQKAEVDERDIKRKQVGSNW